jgi:hypothetical protein
MAHDFFKQPETIMDEAQVGNLLANALQNLEPKTLKGAKEKLEWRQKVMKSQQGVAIAKKLTTRLAQDVAFMVGRNTKKNEELATAMKAFVNKFAATAAADLKKEFNGLQDKCLKEAKEELKKLAKSM